MNSINIPLQDIRYLPRRLLRSICAVFELRAAILCYTPNNSISLSAFLTESGANVETLYFKLSTTYFPPRSDLARARKCLVQITLCRSKWILRNSICRRLYQMKIIFVRKLMEFWIMGLLLHGQPIEIIFIRNGTK